MRSVILAVILLSFPVRSIGQDRPAPIIDIHLHALPADANGPPPLGFCLPFEGFPPFDPKGSWPQTFTEFFKSPQCANPVWSPETERELMEQTLEVLERRNIIGVTSGPLLDDWREPGGKRIIPSLMLGFSRSGPPDLETVRRELESGRYAVLSEVTIQYQGVEPADPRFEPFLALAEELDIPVGIHIGPGPPGAPYLGFTNYRARLHSALLLEEVIVRHPKLRIWIGHAGWPMLDDLLALMWTHPHVYVDTGVISFVLPRREFHRYLRTIVEAGFGKRVMFGSDQMNWPGAIEVAIDAVESAEFLTEEQKRDILYENAARFLRLSEEERANHRGE
jgi:uncharacterized protein